MIISHKHQYIFIKTNKTAGTSIELLLSQSCGPDDIITPLSPVDEEMRPSLGCQPAQHYLAPISSYGIRDHARRLFKRQPKCAYHAHISAAEIQEKVGLEIWNSYTKICVERNPWDRVISLYYWIYRNSRKPVSISDYLRSESILKLKRKGWEVYTIDGKVVVDRVIRFEALRDELAAMSDSLGLKEGFELPRAKAHHRKDKRSYREVFSDQDRQLIAELFADEIELMGYQF